MGLFSGLFGGGGSQATSTTSNVKNTQLAGGDVQGPALNIDLSRATSGGNDALNLTENVTSTDYGAIAAGLSVASDIGGAAINLAGGAEQESQNVAIAGMQSAIDANTSSLAFVNNALTNVLNDNYGLSSGAIDATSQFAGKALDSTQRFASSALDANTMIAGKALDTTGQAFADALSTQATTTQQMLSAVENNTSGIVQQLRGSETDALSTVGAIAAQVSQSSQQSLNDSVVNVVKYIALGVVAIGAIYILAKG